MSDVNVISVVGVMTEVKVMSVAGVESVVLLVDVASLVTCVTVDKLVVDVDVQFARLSGINATTGFIRGVFRFKLRAVQFHSQL